MDSDDVSHLVIAVLIVVAALWIERRVKKHASLMYLNGTGVNDEIERALAG